MRLIDADAWKLDLLLLHGTDERTAWIINRINHAPTVDAVPVRHGKWVQRFIKIGGQDFKHGMQCSVCGESALNAEGDDFLTDYCPFCGAKMDAEREEE